MAAERSGETGTREHIRQISIDIAEWHPQRLAVAGEIAEKYGINLSKEIREPAEGFKERPFIIITDGPPNLFPFWRELDSREPVDPFYKPPTKWWRRGS